MGEGEVTVARDGVGATDAPYAFHLPGRAWYARQPQDVARDLLGAHLTVGSTDGAVTVRITEVEAYGGSDDPGSHAYRGRTARNATMFGPAGRLYVYFTYGMHWCANLVTGTDGVASGVLLRAGEVVDGVGLARSRRTTSKSDKDLASGPARLATALGINGQHDGTSVDAADGHRMPGADVTLRVRDVRPGPISSGPRTGVSGDGGLATYPWRSWLTGDPTVSRYRTA